MRRYISFILRLRWIVLAVFFGLTFFFGYHLSQATISSNPGELFYGENPKYVRYMERNEQFGGDNIALFAYEGEDLFSVENLQRLRLVVKAIEEDPDVERVESLISVQHMESRDGTLYINNYADLVKENPERKNSLLKTLTTDDLTRDLFITADGRNSIVLVEFVTREGSLEELPERIERIYKVFEAQGFKRDNVYRGGMVAIIAEVTELSNINLVKFLPATAIVLLLMVFVMFHRFWPVALTLLITGMAIIWTMGLAVLLYGHLNIFTTVIPAVILIACFADVIHLVSSYLIELSRGETKDAAIYNIGAEVGVACGYTSITTFFGFVSMAMVPTPIFRQTGFLLGFGVATALFMALTLVPVFLRLFPQPKPWMSGSATSVQGILDRVLNIIGQCDIRYPRVVVVFFAVLLAASIYGFTQINFETQFTERFDEDNPIRISLEYFKKHFPGTGTLDIYFEEKGDGDLLEPGKFKKIADFEKWVEGLPQVTQTVSVIDLVRKMNMELYPKTAEKEPIPGSKDALAQLLLLFEMSGGSQLNRFIDSDYMTLRLNTRLHDIGIIETANLGNRIVEEADKLFKADVFTEVISMDYLSGEWVDEIIDGQKRGLLSAFFIIAIIMMIAMRSFRIGLLSMIPNALPLLTLMGYLGLCWENVDTDTISVLMIAIGIGVDNTIHFLMRFRFEVEKIDKTEDAMMNTFHYSGRAIIITSAILIAGFVPFAWSDYFSIRILGTLLPFTLFVSLVANLFLVPAMVELGWIRFEVERKIAKRILRRFRTFLPGSDDF